MMNSTITISSSTNLRRPNNDFLWIFAEIFRFLSSSNNFTFFFIKFDWKWDGIWNGKLVDEIYNKISFTIYHLTIIIISYFLFCFLSFLIINQIFNLNEMMFCWGRRKTRRYMRWDGDMRWWDGRLWDNLGERW